MIRFIVLIIITACATINDIMTKKIKNIIPVLGIIAGIILNIITKEINLFYSIILACAYFFFLFFLPRIFGIKEFLGAGDVKIYMMISFLMGWKFSIYTFIYSIFLGTIFLMLLNFKRIKSIYNNIFLFFSLKNKSIINEVKEKTNIFTPYILMGCILSYLIKCDWLMFLF